MPPAPAPSYLSQPPRSRRALTIALITGFIAAVIVGIALHEAGFFPAGGGNGPVRFSLVQSGKVVWYETAGGKVTVAQGPAGFDALPVSAAALPLASKETPVISGTALALVGSDGTLVSAYDDGAVKWSLTSAPQGLLVFEEAGTGIPHLFSYQLNHSQAKPVPLGTGFSPAFSDAAHIVAIDGEGLMSIDLTGRRRLVLQRAGLTESLSAVAPGGATALLANHDAGTLEVFSVTGGTAALIGSVDATAATAVGFVSPAEFVVKNASLFTFYRITSGAVVKAGTASS